MFVLLKYNRNRFSFMFHNILDTAVFNYEALRSQLDKEIEVFMYGKYFHASCITTGILKINLTASSCTVLSHILGIPVAYY